jgi:hypothetical protein
MVRFIGLKPVIMTDSEDHSDLDYERFRSGNYFHTRKQAVDFLKYKIAELEETTES